MYSALLERQDLMELAMGNFPNIISDAIKNQVDTHDDSIKEALEELDKLKSEATFSGLSRLWEFDKGVHEPYGDNFRKRLMKTLTRQGQDTSNYSFSAGDRDVINFRSILFEDFILNNELSQDGKNFIYMLLNERKKLIGFVYENNKSERKIINPRFFPELFEGIYTGKINNISEIFMDVDITSIVTDEDLFSFYSKEIPEWLVPQHSKVQKDDIGYTIESSKLQLVELAKIN
jgi:hypothetical protein